MTSRGRSGARSAISSVSSCSVAATSSSVLHVRDQRFAHRIRNLEQDIAVAFGLDQVPYHQPLFERQGFENIGDVGRVQLVELYPQCGEVLLMQQLLDFMRARRLVLLQQIVPVPAQQCRHLLQAIVDAGADFFGFGHGTLVSGGLRTGRRILFPSMEAV